MRTEDRLDLIKTHITDVFIGKKSKRNGENEEKNENIAFQFTFDRFYMDFFAPLCVCVFLCCSFISVHHLLGNYRIHWEWMHVDLLAMLCDSFKFRWICRVLRSIIAV